MVKRSMTYYQTGKACISPYLEYYMSKFKSLFSYRKYSLFSISSFHIFFLFSISTRNLGSMFILVKMKNYFLIQKQYIYIFFYFGDLSYNRKFEKHLKFVYLNLFFRFHTNSEKTIAFEHWTLCLVSFGKFFQK